MPKKYSEIIDRRSIPQWLAENTPLDQWKKFRMETRLIDRVFDWIPKCSVLNISNDRFSARLSRKGFLPTTLSSFTPAREIASETVLEFPPSLDFADREFEAVLCYRAYHLCLEAVVRRRIVSELCRVAEKYVAISYVSPGAIYCFKRRLWGYTAKHPSPLPEIDNCFEICGINNPAPRARGIRKA